MLPDGAVERVQEVCASIGEACDAAGVAQWDIMGEQSYGLDLNLEAGRITMVGAGGEGGFGLRLVDNGRFGFARLVDPSGAERAVDQALSILRKAPQIPGFELPSPSESASVHSEGSSPSATPPPPSMQAQSIDTRSQRSAIRPIAC